jgi:peptidoglycan glycosyltransferase
LFENRMRWILAGFGCLGLLFLCRVFFLQTYEAGEARRALEGRLTAEILLPPRRGSIVDADGAVLARDEVGYDLTADPFGLGAMEWECEGCGRVTRTYESDAGAGATTEAPGPAAPPSPCTSGACGGRARWVPTYASDRLALAGLLGVPEEVFAAELDRARLLGWEEARKAATGRDERWRRQVLRDRLTRVRPLRKDVGREAAMEVFLNPERYPGLHAEARAHRARAEGLDGATLRILGTTGPLLKEDLDERREDLEREGLSGALLARIVFGRSGLERIFDRELRGDFGLERRERDIYGRSKSREVLEPARDGPDLRLTLSTRLQAAAEAALAGRKGGLLAMDPRTGAILALAGVGEDGEPLPAVAGLVPGSVVKALTALVAVENGLAPAAGEVECRGKDSKPISCEHEHGAPGLVVALGDSCNAYFAATGIRVGVRPMRDFARRLHLDEPYGIGIPLEGGGTEWSQRVYRAPWTRTDMANLGIGQGKIVLSALQVGSLFCAIANGGRPVKPFLVEGRGAPAEAPAFLLETLAEVRAGLEATVRTGTASEAGLGRFRAAGKTGTAEVKKGTGTWNAWFAGYAPAEDPRVVVVVVLLDSPRSGGHAAAPVVAEFLAAFEEWERSRR